MSIKTINKLPWPENLLRRVFYDESYDEWKKSIPPDFEESLKYVLEETLTERESYVLYSFYRDRIPMRIIGQRYDIQAERCRQIKDRALRRIRHPSRIKYLRKGITEVERCELVPQKEIPYIQRPIEDLDFSVKAYICLMRANVRIVGDLTSFTRRELMKVTNAGVKTIAEVESKLYEKGLSLLSDNR